MQTDGQKGNIKRDNKTNRQTQRQTDIERQTYKQTDKKGILKETHIQTDKHRDRQIKRYTHTHIQTDRQKGTIKKDKGGK